MGSYSINAFINIEETKKVPLLQENTKVYLK